MRPLIAPLEVRPAHAGDIGALERLSTGPIAGKRAFLDESLTKRDVRVATVDDVPAGFVVWDRSFFGRPFVWLLGVAPMFRRRGIAGRLMREFESACAGEALFTSTNESNHAMQELLTARGYVQSGRLEHLDPGDPELFYWKPAAA